MNTENLLPQPQFDAVLKRMLNAPPKPKPKTTEKPADKKKPA